jgi:uncharacterized protein YwbE
MRLFGSLRFLLFSVGALQLASGLSTSPSSSTEVSRLHFWKQLAAATTAAYCSIGVVASPVSATTSTDKLLNLSNDQLKEIVKHDVVQNAFLATGDITRGIYDESATFTDEIDSYGMDQWIEGTKKLFNGKQSSVRLVGDVNVSPAQVDFLFDEDLQFNLPLFLRPTVHLTGKVVLKRDAKTGLITSYREYWDQDVLSVLKTAKF